MNWNTVVTIICFTLLAIILVVTACMVIAMKRDVRNMDEERERELRDWNENQ